MQIIVIEIKKKNEIKRFFFFPRVNFLLVFFLEEFHSHVEPNRFDVQTVNACMHVDTGTDLDFLSQETSILGTVSALKQGSKQYSKQSKKVFIFFFSIKRFKNQRF